MHFRFIFRSQMSFIVIGIITFAFWLWESLFVSAFVRLLCLCKTERGNKKSLTFPFSCATGGVCSFYAVSGVNIDINICINFPNKF